MERTIKGQAEQIYIDHQQQIYRQTDRMFAVLMAIQWAAGVIAALVISPRTWIGQTSNVHLHVWAALFLGGIISFFPILLAVLRPGYSSTRYAIAVGQMLMSSLLVHLTGGRIETHFHIFGSLAFLSFYRDWRVLLPATIVVALDHMFRGIFYPQSVFGVLSAENWRWLEHAGWVIFEDIFLVLSCLRGQKEMLQIAENTAKLDASEARYRTVTNSASDAIITFDETGQILFVNQSAEKIFGYSSEELVGEDLVKLMPGKVFLRFRARIRRYISIEKRNIAGKRLEVKAKHKDGQEILIEVSFGEYDAGAERVITAVGRDITERKRAEEALRKSEEYRNLFKHANDSIIIFDPESEIVLDANDSACKMYGYSREELIGRRLKNMSASIQTFEPHSAGTANSHAIDSFESIHYQKDGTPVHVLINSSIIEFEGKPAVLSINRDITSRVLATNALSESEYKFRTLIENMSEGLLHLDQNDCIIFTNKRFCEISGYREEELLGQNASALLLDEEGRKITEKANQRRRQGISENYELQLRTAQGNTVWSLVGAVPTIDTNGNIIGSMSIHTDITERKHAEEQLVHNALHDNLTGLPNRALFLEHLRRAIGHSPLRKKTFAVLFLDFDGFKLINDSLGHMEGDNLLKMIARRLESLLRGDDVVARLGGDEFTILLDDLTDSRDVFFIVERIQELFKEPFDLGGRKVFISASIGIAHRDAKYKTPEEMLRDADIAMYRAKSSGKGKHETFNHAMHEQISNRLRLESELRQALERREFSVFYQPIMEIATNQLIGFEALVRWLHPERGCVMPGEFIPIVEETGLIVPLGEWILRESCRQIREWQRRIPAGRELTVSVNLSCKQFMQSDLVSRVAEILRETELEARFLRLEVTESHIMENSQMAITIMSRLRQLGIQLSIDDFGTGYSSLSYLQRLPINYLKIDRSFINMMNSNPENGEIVRAIVMLAKNLKMQVIAEGIETEEQALQLISLDCTFGQGYYYSKPTSAKQTEAILETLQPLQIPERLTNLSFDIVS
ncbi:MAG TPA: EAL domain-containing protein [Pyrinomonadaceae bacterium]|nr:EAL domain-containing protein [Pyrinomonadaceae bacterium]